MFETERLAVRRLALEDASFLLAMLNDPGFITHIGDRGVRTVRHAEEYLRSRIFASYEKHGFGMFRVALKADDVPIGLVGFVRRDGLDGPDLGFAFLAAHVGQGYGREAAEATIAWGRRELAMGPLLAITAPGNVASAALLERLGFREKGRVMLPEHGGESRLFVESPPSSSSRT